MATILAIVIAALTWLAPGVAASVPSETLLAQARVENQSIRAKRKKTKAKGKKKKRVRRTPSPKGAPTSSSPFELGDGIAALTMLALAVLLYRHRRDEEDEAPPARLAPQAPARKLAFEARPVDLGHRGPDPAALNYGRLAIDLDADQADENRRAAAELDVLLGAQSARAKEAAPEALDEKRDVDPDDVQLRRANARLVLPPEMGGHFEPLDGEKTRHAVPWNVQGVSEGHLVVTSRRILALYHKVRWQLVPLPKVWREQRRHQVPLATITSVRVEPARRPSFLVLGLAVGWWFPVGVVLAVLAGAAYFVLTRPELCVVANGSLKRTYPLDSVDLPEARRAIEEAMAKESKDGDRKAS